MGRLRDPRRRGSTSGASGAGALGSCAAPSTSLRFEPDGRVSVCCINGQYALGRVPEQSLAEIWDGIRRERLRDAIADGDFSLGCFDCKEAHESGRRLETEAREFDRLVGADVGRWPRRLEFALSNTCNLECVHCNGELSSAIRARREGRPPLHSPYGDAFFEQLEQFLPHTSELAFLGGEPFLSRRARRVWDRLIELGPSSVVYVTTNGTVLDDRVEHYVRELEMHLTVSIDGYSTETFEAIRRGADRDQTFGNCERLARMVRSHDGAMGVNVCVMRDNWREIADVLSWAEGLGATARCIVVTYPRSMSLVELPTPDLEHVIDELDRQDEQVRSRLDATLPAWDGLRRQLRGALQSRTTEVAVLLSDGPRREHSDPIVRFEEVVAARAADAGCLPVILEGEEDIVASVTDQPWAATYEFSGMAGQSLLRLLPTLVRRLGVEPHLDIADLGDGLVATRIEMVHPRWACELTSIMVERRVDGRRHFRVAVVAPGGATPPTDAVAGGGTVSLP